MSRAGRRAPGRALGVDVLWVRCSDEGSLDLAGVPGGRYARVRRVERDLGVDLLAPRIAATTRRARAELLVQIERELEWIGGR